MTLYCNHVDSHRIQRTNPEPGGGQTIDTAEKLYTVPRAAKTFGEPPYLIYYLIYDHEVPHMVIASTLVIDEAGFAILTGLVEDYRRKVGRVKARRCKKGRPRQRRPELASA